MKSKIIAFAVFVSGLLAAVPSLSVALDPPVVLDPAVIMDPLSKDGAQSDIRYMGQPAKEGKIDLTAANGFFDRCFQAFDQHDRVPGDERFIPCSFGSIGRASDQVPGTARWHLWCFEPGEITAIFFLRVPAGESGQEWTIRVGDETQTLKANENTGDSAQAQTLTFTVKQPGKVTFAIDCTKTPPAAETRIEYIRLQGSAVNKASLLRTRYRPSAAHGHFFAPENCPTPKMWVFETVDVAKTGSYSPLTTPFGYYGLVFKNGGQIPQGAGFNFSMWIAGRTATAAPPIDQMARLIGTDIPDAQYSTFGGEGTGVKFRASAYNYTADRTIQALRVEADGDIRTFYGYFYDEHEKKWKLYASAQESAKRKNMSGLLASTGSFCEIPGPPDKERSGDLVREIKRRGWFYGSDQHWYRAQLGREDSDENEPGSVAEPDEKAGDSKPAADNVAKKPKARGKAQPQTQPAGAIAERASSQRFYYTKDYPTEGWIGMSTGGIELYAANPAAREKPKQKDAIPASPPEYLALEKAAQLFELPVEFGASKASQIAADHATIDYEIKKTGPNSRAILYYGTVDSLTYPAREVTKGSPVEIDMARPERTWQAATQEQKITTGTAQFKLVGLKPATKYYYRLFVAHDQGKSWDYHSGQFTTNE